MHNFQLPPIGQLDITTAKRWMEEHQYYQHPLFAKWRGQYRRAELYDQGLQWLKRGMAPYDSAGFVSQWASIYYEPADPNYIPTPVFNEGHGSRTNESARLGRPNYRPLVVAKGSKPNYKMREAAKKATDLLRHRLKEMEWDKQAYKMFYHIPVYGGAWVKSQWEQRWDQTTMVPESGAVACPNAKGAATPPDDEASYKPTAADNLEQNYDSYSMNVSQSTGMGESQKKPCPFILSSPSIPKQMMGKAAWLGGAEAPFDPTSMSYQAKACPLCPDHPPLVAFQATMNEAVTGKDTLGRPLGNAQPLGDWVLSVVDPFNMHPKNLGFGMASGDISEWCEVHVETLDWVALRYPEKAAAVKPERPDVIAKYSPTLGSPDLFSSIIDAKIMKDSVRVMEWHKKPWMEKFVGPDGNTTFRLNEGRSIVVANNVILLDAPYLIPSALDPMKKVGRIEIDYIPWEIMEGGRFLQGLSLWSLLFDPQDNANEIRSQAQSVRQRMAVPLYIALKSHNLEIATRDGVPGRFAFIDIDPEAPNLIPQIINNTTIAEGVWKELEDTISSLEKYAGNVEVEKGQVPPNVEAAIAIQTLKTYAGERREPRLARIKESLRRLWKHGLELMTALYIEPREVSYENEAEEERWTSLTGLDISGDNVVTVEAEADYDDKARNQELVLSLVRNGIVQINGPQGYDAVMAREVSRILEAPESLFEVHDIQTDGAQREYVEFHESGKIPVVDPSLDDHGAHYRQHGIDAHSEWFRDLEERAGWDEALKVLGAQWDMLLTQVAMTPGPLCLQERIFDAWSQTLQAAMQPQPMIGPDGLPMIGPDGMPMTQPPLLQQPQDPEALEAVLRWRAHAEDHRLTQQMKEMQAMMGPVMAAPGAAAAAGGTEPTPEAAPAAAQPPA